MTRLSLLPRAYGLPPLGDTLTRADLVERLRLLWQLSPEPAALIEALELVIDALGLAAERIEILGEMPERRNRDDRTGCF
jgi:hypothetical protein